MKRLEPGFRCLLFLHPFFILAAGNGQKFRCTCQPVGRLFLLHLPGGNRLFGGANSLLKRLLFGFRLFLVLQFLFRSCKAEAQVAFLLICQELDRLYAQLNRVEGFFCAGILFENLAGDGGIQLRPGQLLQQGCFFSLFGFQESGEVVLRQQYGTRKLLEGQPYQVDDTGLQLGTRPLLLLRLIQVIQGQTGILQTSVFLVTGTRDGPARPVAVSVQCYKIHFGIARSRASPQQETGIALRQLFIADILQLDIVFLRLIRTGRTGEQCQTHGV